MPNWTKLIITAVLLTTIANIGMISYFILPRRPIATARELFDHPGFKKAVEGITQAKGYLTETEVEKLIERCRVVTGGKIKCD